jgi:hypothetical protein
MLNILIVTYLVGWLLVTFAAYAAGRRLSDRQTAPDQPLMVVLSLAAGAVWPLLVVGLVELSSVVVFTRAPTKIAHSDGMFA